MFAFLAIVLYFDENDCLFSRVEGELMGIFGKFVIAGILVLAAGCGSSSNELPGEPADELCT
jgi:hypothetical protein